MEHRPAWMEALSLRDFEALARECMPPDAYDYYAGGAADEVTLRANTAAFDRRRLRPRVLSGVSSADASARMLGASVSMPVGLAPAALQRLAHPEGELATARAAARTGTIFCLSTMSSCSIEDVAQATSGDWWFQLYVQKDRGVSEELVRRAAGAGCRAIVLTVDLPVPGYRERELRGGVRLPDHHPGNLDRRSLPDESLLEHIARSFDSSLSWSDLGWVRSLCPLPLVIKGILTAEDALLAAEHGASAIVVSNHGGRQLDRSRPAWTFWRRSREQSGTASRSTWTVGSAGAPTC